MQIIDKSVPSFNERNGHKPVIIVNHISVGSMGSMYNTFLNKGNRASSHYGVGRDGSIAQYVPMGQAAWTQGKIQDPKAPIIKQLGGDPNKYAVSIEHEGYAGNGLDGDLTEVQFYSTCWLHKHIQTGVELIYGVRIPLNSHQVIGHFQIDSKGKPYCPGPKFPWARLYSELAIADTMTLPEYEERLNYLQSGSAERVFAYSFAERVQDLWERSEDPRWGQECIRKIMLLEPVMSQLGLVKESTPQNIAERVRDIYNNTVSQRFEAEGMRKLLIGAKFAKELGLL